MMQKTSSPCPWIGEGRHATLQPSSSQQCLPCAHLSVRGHGYAGCSLFRLRSQAHLRQVWYAETLPLRCISTRPEITNARFPSPLRGWPLNLKRYSRASSQVHTFPAEIQSRVSVSLERCRNQAGNTCDDQSLRLTVHRKVLLPGAKQNF